MGTLKEKISTNMVRELIKIAGDHGVKKRIIDNFLDTQAQSKYRTEKSRRYRHLIERQFSIDKIVRIDRKNDPNTISNKFLTYDTLNHFRKAGYMDAIYDPNR